MNLKKVLFIILICLICSGCSNYQELNSLSIISNITITNNNDNYKVTMQEIIPTKGDNKVDYQYKYRVSSSSSLKKAINNITNHSPKKIYLKKVQNVIIDYQNKDKIIKEFYKYYKSNKEFNNDSSIIITKNDLKKVLKTNSNYKYIASVLKNKKILLRNLSSKKKNKIPILKIISKELVFVKYYHAQL